MGKKVKKAFKSITKVVSKVPGSGFSDDSSNQKAPVVEAAPVQQQANAVEIAKEEPKDDTETDTESAKKRAKAKGKQGLSVARSSGTGINV